MEASLPYTVVDASESLQVKNHIIGVWTFEHEDGEGGIADGLAKGVVPIIGSVQHDLVVLIAAVDVSTNGRRLSLTVLGLAVERVIWGTSVHFDGFRVKCVAQVVPGTVDWVWEIAFAGTRVSCCVASVIVWSCAASIHGGAVTG